jgi:RNA polymerase sigma factor (TIGR02999 family)
MAEDLRQITRLLLDWRGGDRVAFNEIIARMYPDLRRLAAHYMRDERSGHTLQPTALVHELYLKLLPGEPLDWQNRAHFVAVAAQQLRRMLIDHARSIRAERRGGNRVKLSLEEVEGWGGNTEEDLLALDQALERLEKLDPRCARLIELRFFGGLKEREAAEVLGISLATLKRDWTFARAWLIRRLQVQRAETAEPAR